MKTIRCFKVLKNNEEVYYMVDDMQGFLDEMVKNNYSYSEI